MQVQVLMLFLLGLAAVEGQRQGWKTYGNGYFVYKNQTDFYKTNLLNIEGMFSTIPNRTNEFTFLAVYDANEKFTFQLGVKQDIFFAAYPMEKDRSEEKRWRASKINDGYAFRFIVKVNEVNRTTTSTTPKYGYKIAIQIPGVRDFSDTYITFFPNVTRWNYTAITIKIGGNLPFDPIGAKLFKGCLSGFKFMGVDIIDTYFRQYPNNTNPVRGKEMFVKDGHIFSNVSQLCNDPILPTTIARTTTTSKTPQATTRTANTNNGTTPTSTAAAKHTTKPQNGGNIFCHSTVFFIVCLSCAYFMN